MVLSLRYNNLFNFLLFFGLITVPVSALFSRIVFLSIFSFCLLVLAFLALKKKRRVIWNLILISFIYLLTTAALRPDYSLISLRLFFVILTILVASYYCQRCNTKDLLKLARVIFVIGIFSSILGLKQFLVGYSDLDEYLLFFKGSGALFEDFEKFNRSRSLGITFDPLSQGIFLGLTLHCIILLNKIEKKFYIKFFYILSFLIILVSLLATLNRTSTVAVIMSMLIYFNFHNLFLFFRKISWIIKIFFLIIFVWLILLILGQTGFENINIGLKAIFRAMGIYDSSENVGDYFSRGKSLEIRLAIISNAWHIMLENPFGIKESTRVFSTNDVGIFSPILKYGLIGGGFIVFILLIPLIGLFKFYFLRKRPDTNNDIVGLIYAFYIIALITNTISFSLDGTIMMLPFWVITFLGVHITIYNKKFDKILNN